jgi:hypothetical protein
MDVIFWHKNDQENRRVAIDVSGGTPSQLPSVQRNTHGKVSLSFDEVTNGFFLNCELVSSI